jgi:hypothetical protein
VSPGKLEPSIAVVTAGDDDVTVTVDIVTESGIIVDAREITLDSTAPALIAIEDLAVAPYGVRLRATAPVVATVVATVPDLSEDAGDGSLDESPSTTAAETDTTVTTEEEFARGLAGTTGIPELAKDWIVPVETLPGSETTLWMMNSGVELATVNVVALSEEDALYQETVEVAPGTVAPIPVPVGTGVFGYRLTSDVPISAAWEIVGDKGVALIAGIPAG